MSETSRRDRATADALRQAFDRSFATAALPKPARASLLCLRIGGDPYAFRLADVVGLHREKTIARAATTFPELLGMAGFRGVVAPVYDLGMLLGYPRARAPRWLVLARGSAPIALAFEVFEAHLQVELADLSSEATSSARPHVEGAIRHSEGVRALIRIASLVEAIVERARHSGPVKER